MHTENSATAPALQREPRKKRRTRLMSRVMMLCALFFFFCVDEFVRFTPSLPLCHHLLHVKLLLELLRFCATFWMNMLLDTGRFWLGGGLRIVTDHLQLDHAALVRFRRGAMPTPTFDIK